MILFTIIFIAILSSLFRPRYFYGPRFYHRPFRYYGHHRGPRMMHRPPMGGMGPRRF